MTPPVQSETAWKLVPVEATAEMIDAARHFLEPSTERIGRATWRAMLDAAPASPPPPATEVGELVERVWKQLREFVYAKGDVAVGRSAYYNVEAAKSVLATLLQSQAAALAEARRDLEIAERAVVKFQAIAEDNLADTRLVNAGGRVEGGFGFDFTGGPIPYITEYLFQFIGARDEKGPSNYAEIEVSHHEFGAMTLTLQRRSGKTPHQLRTEADARADAAEAKLKVAEEALRAVVTEETVSVHVGYDDGAGGGNFVYADAVRTDSDAFRRAREALATIGGGNG